MPKQMLMRAAAILLGSALFGGAALGLALGHYVTAVLPSTRYAGYTLPDRGTALAQADTASRARAAAYAPSADDTSAGTAAPPAYYRAVAY